MPPGTLHVGPASARGRTSATIILLVPTILALRLGLCDAIEDLQADLPSGTLVYMVEKRFIVLTLRPRSTPFLKSPPGRRQRRPAVQGHPASAALKIQALEAGRDCFRLTRQHSLRLQPKRARANGAGVRRII